MKPYLVFLVLIVTSCTLPVEDLLMAQRHHRGYPGNELDYDTVHDAGGTFNPDGYGAPPVNPDASIQDIINAIKHDGRVLDPKSVQAIGNSVKLRPPSRQTGLGVPLAPFEGPNLDVAATTILQATADVQDSPKDLIVTINPASGIFFGNGLTYAPDIKARIFWGTGGTFAVADVDCINGTQISIQGNYVRVDGLYLQYFPDPGVNTTPPDVTLGATIGYGTRAGSSTPPTWTRNNPALLQLPAVEGAGAGTSQTFQIPSFAKDVTVYARTGTGIPPVQLGFGFNAGATNFIRISQGVDEAPVRIIPGAAQVLTIINPNQFPIGYTAVFGLAL